MFQSFIQAINSRLGYTLIHCQKMVEAMQGTISFYSAGEDYGFTVTITLPLFSDSADS
jgi:signal transduction histidine kinase